jgi:hypothetical protein
MENDKQLQIQRRLARMEELDGMLERGELTLEDVRAIPPTETSLEHHQTLKRILSGKAIDTCVSL